MSRGTTYLGFGHCCVCTCVVFIKGLILFIDACVFHIGANSGSLVLLGMATIVDIYFGDTDRAAD